MRSPQGGVYAQLMDLEEGKNWEKIGGLQGGGVSGNIRGENEMAVDRQGFCKKVSDVINARDVMYSKLALTDPILYPIKTHVNGFRVFGGDRTVG